MNVAGRAYRSIWPIEERAIAVIDQRQLPHDFVIAQLATWEQAAAAIRSMQVRGAPLIGAAAAYGVALAINQLSQQHGNESATDAEVERVCAALLATRPTAVNLRWALERMRGVIGECALRDRAVVAWREAAAICDEDVALNRAIAQHGLPILRGIAASKGVVQVLTHCNAGWLATVDVGTALAPVYAAFDAGLKVHVWVSETRPRNQGAALTCWELAQHGVPHTLVADNAAGLLLRRAQVDIVLVGADRVTRAGDVCNKIGTYLKAVAARDCGVPFYAAVPSPTIDWHIDADDIVIEERDAAEVLSMSGRNAAGELQTVAIAPTATSASNFAFDVTPARLVSGLITECGVCDATPAGIDALFGATKP
jgi:methylthioribose-1-phosphate isomerase